MQGVAFIFCFINSNIINKVINVSLIFFYQDLLSAFYNVSKPCLELSTDVFLYLSPSSK